MECSKKKEHVVVRPLTDSINLQEDRLEEEKEKPDSQDLTYDHHEEMRPVSHPSHQSDLYKK